VGFEPTGACYGASGFQDFTDLAQPRRSRPVWDGLRDSNDERPPAIDIAAAAAETYAELEASYDVDEEDA